DRRGPRAADPAPAVAGRPAAAGDGRPARVLGAHLSGSEEGDEGALPEAPVAGRSVERDGDAPAQAARKLNPGARRSRRLNGRLPRLRASPIPSRWQTWARSTRRRIARWS